MKLKPCPRMKEMASVVAMVVDECDSTMACDDQPDCQPPCANVVVDALKAVWKTIGVPKKYRIGLDITWSDALSTVD
ncbi:Uncharacterized protein TCM_005352 [Theobroma cacao]|uniref:Uncharacterized protein n=1 Tax=Theobroma cacao TaxID=3641 RepID=A0A061E137_THECC|nr:Uncharacterized protein TCM_005352 [Theobroma cacao]